MYRLWRVIAPTRNSNYHLNSHHTKNVVETGIIKASKQELGGNLAPGFYLIKLVSEQKSKVVKLNKTR